MSGNIIDLSKIEELKVIKIQSDEINMGSMVTFTSILNSEVLSKKAKLLCKAAAAVGSPQIRNRGTIGGNICNASAAADAVSSLVCLEAKVDLKSMDTKGAIQSRMIAIEDFVIASGKTLLEKNEILTNIVFKIPYIDGL
ncbi:FAD binding domain-containing protein [Desulfosporosinus fructosivorans]